MSDYIPKVGEKCLWVMKGTSQDRIVEIEFFDDEVFAGKVDKKSVAGYLNHLKPLPAEEEKLIDEIYKDSMHYSGPIECRITKDAAKALIKAGYRKIEPISFSEYAEYINTTLSHEKEFKSLADNKHIIIKGE